MIRRQWWQWKYVEIAVEWKGGGNDGGSDDNDSKVRMMMIKIIKWWCVLISICKIFYWSSWTKNKIFTTRK